MTIVKIEPDETPKKDSPEMSTELSQNIKDSIDQFDKASSECNSRLGVKSEPENSAHSYTEGMTIPKIDLNKEVPESVDMHLHGLINSLMATNESIRKENSELKAKSKGHFQRLEEIEQLKADKQELLTTLVFAVDELPEITDMYPQVSDVIQKHSPKP